MQRKCSKNRWKFVRRFLGQNTHVLDNSSETKEVEECLFEVEHPELKAEIEAKRLLEMEKTEKKQQFKREAIVKAEKRSDKMEDKVTKSTPFSKSTPKKLNKIFKKFRVLLLLMEKTYSR